MRPSTSIRLRVLALAFVILSGCGPPSDELRNVVLITIDTLRADFLGCYGHDQIQTPVIDRLCKEGFQFRRAYAQSHITLPSHVSILTSLYPKDHGVNQNRRYRLDPDITTLADVLKESGFQTVAVTSNKTLGPNHIVGLGRGFQEFHVPNEPERNAADTNSVFFPWLERHRNERFFAWLHYFDVHLPYEPPPEYRTLYYDGDPTDERFDSMDRVVFPAAWMNPDHWSNRLIAWLDGVRDFDYAVSQYAGEVSYVDTMIGALLKRLTAFGIDRNTLIVLTSDHGESMGEHEIYLGHFALYEASTHIPLIFWAASRLDLPGASDALVMSIDVMPTVLDLLGIASRPRAMRGRSLTPLMSPAATEDQHGYVFAERERQTQVMVRSRDWKYIKTLLPVRITPRFGAPKGKRELYHIATDPGETMNLARREPQRVEEFEKVLAEWLAEPRGAPAQENVGAPADYLKALGYVE